MDGFLHLKNIHIIWGSGIHVKEKNLPRLLSPSAGLAAVLVHEDLRGQGIGSKLVEKAKEWTREKGLSRLLVSSQTYRTEAHRFYEKQGFVRWKESMFFETAMSFG